METYNKLVRDNIPEIITKSGKTPKVRILNNHDYKWALLEKLIEESTEAVNASNRNELVKELGDIFEVLDYTMKAFAIEASEVTELKNKRKAERGGFDKQIFLEHVE
jgi:predicted house-cleaning noncanonical NTP pyrophosphatase (MazG superfamily)